METLSKTTLKYHHHHHHQQPFFLNSIQQNRPLFFSKPNLISFSKPRFSPLKINSSSKIPNSISIAPNPKTLNPNSRNPFAFLKTPLTIAVATAAIFFSGLSHKSISAFAETPKNAVEETTAIEDDEEREKRIEEYVSKNPNDVEGLKSLMEIRLKNKNLGKAVEALNRLIEIEPQEIEWTLLRAHMYSYMGETEMAKAGFEEIIAKEPLRVEAFHGLVLTVSQGDDSGGGELSVLSERINEAIEKCKKEKKKDEVRDFKLLIAQIRVIEGNHDEALRIYEELAKEEPRDYRPYLCQGIIYTLLRKKDEADKQFEKYKRLVPQDHPYARYFEDNMMATKAFSQMAENQRETVGATR